MIVYSNEKINVLANTRCGSTSIGVFFGLGLQPENRYGLKEWMWEFEGKKVVILRNPYDRVVSAYKTVLEQDFGDNKSPESFFVRHSFPYLHMIQKHDFSIILFENLSKYVPQNLSGTTNTSNVSNGTYIKNSGYSVEDLYYEYLLYRTCLLQREVLSVESWNMLCER